MDNSTLELDLDIITFQGQLYYLDRGLLEKPGRPCFAACVKAGRPGSPLVEDLDVQVFPLCKIWTSKPKFEEKPKSNVSF